MFTPRTFLDLAEGMALLGWLPFRIAAFAPTLENELEFIVRFGPCDDIDAIRASIAEARSVLAAAVVPPEERGPPRSPVAAGEQTPASRFGRLRQAFRSGR